MIGRSCRGRSRIDPADGLHRPCHGTCDAFHPVIGRTDSRDRPGTWITFNVGDDPVLNDECTNVMGASFQAGGRMIDCSPMYGSSQSVIGYGLDQLGRPEKLFSAEKSGSSAADGAAQIERSRRFWDVRQFDLVQVHNLVTWEAHPQTLFEMKASGQIRYVGITAVCRVIQHSQESLRALAKRYGINQKTVAT